MDILFQLERIRTPYLTELFKTFTVFGEHVVLVAIICAIYWCYDKQSAYRIAFGLFVSAILVQGLKITFRIPRPWIRNPELNPVQAVIDTATGYSFPSGHTQGATSLFGMLALITRKRWLKVVCLCLIFGVAFSRMYLGVHTLQDVSASVLVTGAVILIVYQVLNVKFTNRTRKMVAIAIGIGSASLLTYSLVMLTTGTIEYKYATDSCKAACAGLGLAIGWYIESSKIQFDVKTTKWYWQLPKYILGITILITIKLVLESILGSTILGEGITNFVLVLWIMVFYPLMIKKASVLL